jgi:hypothetical protein
VWKLSGYEKVEESIKNISIHLLKEVFSVKIIETESYFILQCRQITYLVIKK